MLNFQDSSTLKKRSALAIFCRAPRLGTVKTRIAQTRGDEFALGLYRAMLADTFALGRALAPEVETFACFTPADGFEGADSLADLWDGPHLAQCDGDLDVKILDCFAQLRARGFEKIVVIGSDSPDVWLAWLKKAFRKLDRLDSVQGMTEDGGFWILGSSNPLPLNVFHNVIWSGPNVSDQIWTNLNSQKPRSWRMTFLPQWFDCDDARDLNELQRRLTLSEPQFTPNTRDFLEKESPQRRGDVENWRELSP